MGPLMATNPSIAKANPHPYVPHAYLQIAFPKFTAKIIRNIVCKKDSFMALFVKIFKRTIICA